MTELDHTFELQAFIDLLKKTDVAHAGFTIGKDQKPSPLEKNSKHLEHVLKKLIGLLESDEAYQTAVSSDEKTIELFIHAKKLNQLGGFTTNLFAGKPPWEHTDFVYCMSCVAKAEGKTHDAQRLWFIYVGKGAEITEFFNTIHRNPQAIFEAIIPHIAGGQIRSSEGEKIIFSSGRHALLLRNSQYGGNLIENFKSKPFPKPTSFLSQNQEKIDSDHEPLSVNLPVEKLGSPTFEVAVLRARSRIEAAVKNNLKIASVREILFLTQLKASTEPTDALLVDQYTSKFISN